VLILNISDIKGIKVYSVDSQLNLYLLEHGLTPIGMNREERIYYYVQQEVFDILGINGVKALQKGGAKVGY